MTTTRITSTLSAIALALVAFTAQAQEVKENPQATAIVKAHFEGFTKATADLAKYDRYQTLTSTTPYYEEHKTPFVGDGTELELAGSFVPRSALRNKGLASDVAKSDFFAEVWFTFPVTTGDDFKEYYGNPAYKLEGHSYRCINYPARKIHVRDITAQLPREVLIYADTDASGRTIQVKVTLCDGLVDSVEKATYLYDYKADFARKKMIVDKDLAEMAAYKVKVNRHVFR